MASCAYKVFVTSHQKTLRRLFHGAINRGSRCSACINDSNKDKGQMQSTKSNISVNNRTANSLFYAHTFKSNQRTSNFIYGVTNTRHYHSVTKNIYDPLCASNSSLLITSRRHISQETYNNWFSPEVGVFGYTQNLLESVHDFTGLPWWASIALSTVALRTLVTVPFALYTQHNMARLDLLRPEVEELAKELGKETSQAVKMFGWSQERARKEFKWSLKKHLREIYIRENCHPLKNAAVAVIQVPLWISLSMTLRNMSGGLYIGNETSPVLVPELATEGLLWFPDLTLADTTFVLPVIVAVCNLINIEMNTLRPGEKTTAQKVLINVFRSMSLVMIPIGGVVPSSLCWYWFCSSVFGLVQNILFKMPAVRRLVRLPETSLESKTPFKDMLELAKIKYLRRENPEKTDVS